MHHDGCVVGVLRQRGPARNLVEAVRQAEARAPLVKQLDVVDAVKLVPRAPMQIKLERACSVNQCVASLRQFSLNVNIQALKHFVMSWGKQLEGMENNMTFKQPRGVKERCEDVCGSSGARGSRGRASRRVEGENTSTP